MTIRPYKKIIAAALTAVLAVSMSLVCFAAADDDEPDRMDDDVSYEEQPAYEPEPEPEYTAPEDSYEETALSEIESEPDTDTETSQQSGETQWQSEETWEDYDTGYGGGTDYVSGSYSRDCPNTWENTGDQCWDMIQVALTQVGYSDTYNHTKYNVWFFGYDCGAAWCATFLSWCAAQADIPSYVLEATAAANPERFGVDYRSAYYNDAQAGDLVFVENDSSNGYAGFDHVGLVYYVDEDFIYTVEGNYTNSVQCCVYARDTGRCTWGGSDRVVWLATPDYEDNSEPETPLPVMDVHLALDMGKDGGTVDFIVASLHGNEIVYQCSLNEPLSRVPSYDLEGLLSK